MPLVVFAVEYDFVQSSVTVVGSTVPRILEAAREVLIKDAGCASK